MRKDRRETNPALSSRRLKLGTFQTNLDSGCVMSDLDGRLDISWPNTVALARLAEEMEFEALVPVARWQGYGGATNPQGPGFEAYTWAAGIAASTSRPGVFADLAHLAQSPDHCRQAVDGDRPYLERPLRAQCGDRLEPARDRNVRPGHAEPRGPLRLRRGMACHHQAAVDRGRRVRSRRPVLQDRERLSAAQADPASLSGDHECGRLRTRPALRGQALRPRLHRHSHRRAR